MDPTEIDLDQFETIADVEDLIGGDAHPAWMLTCQIPMALGVSIEESAAVKKDAWTDEDEEWALYLNGSGEPWYPVVVTLTDQLPAPCSVEVFAGSHLVMVDELGLLEKLSAGSAPIEPSEAKNSVKVLS